MTKEPSNLGYNNTIFHQRITWTDGLHLLQLNMLLKDPLLETKKIREYMYD